VSGKSFIKPTIGRVVYFYPMGPDSAPNAAIICWVESDTKVNLTVFDHHGNARGRANVELWQGPEGAEPKSKAYCSWMPYQKQVAAGEIPAVKHLSPETASGAS